MIGLHTNERGWRLALTWLTIALFVALIVGGVNALAVAVSN